MYALLCLNAPAYRRAEKLIKRARDERKLHTSR